MGIPKFAKFLINRYPLILKKIKDERDVPTIDNLYLDINGVIHKRAHNNSMITMCSGRSNEDIFYDIFLYIDEIVHLIKPKSVLVISADGVAPRAKMNQQRTRRFRKSDINPKEIEAIKKHGLNPSNMFNSDCISAGTEFMYELSIAFHEFVEKKLKTDLLWKDLKVIITGSDVPGEGEHKIIEYIRNYKNSPEFASDTKHCIYGLDADLIMLSLITHEPNINILREEVFGVKKNLTDPFMRQPIKINEKFEFIYISLLREYLELEFLELNNRLKFPYNIERIIDDFVFFCFFIGNDFLPNLNTLDIDHGALDNIFMYYKEVLPTLDDYITYHGKIDFNKAEKIFIKLASHELNSLTQLLKKVTVQCHERDKKKQKDKHDRINMLKRKKMNAKKENFLVKIKSNDESFLINFKKTKVTKKINGYKERYNQEMVYRGVDNFVFNEDFKNFQKDQIQKNIKKIHNKDDISDLNFSDKYESESNTENDNNKPKKIICHKTKNLTTLFNSDDESEPIVRVDKIEQILKEVSRFDKYINDDNYCSDINIDDIDDDDISQISDVEDNFIEIKDLHEFTESQDMDKVFQSKLVEFYVKDVSKAKSFYYKEKLGIDLETDEGINEHKKLFRSYLEGLQWVLYYYYRGVKCWRWYYPYHYPPMISDFEKVRDFLDYDIDKNFIVSPPYTPIQSLLFILPQSSKSLIPKCYWSLYDSFPHYYPLKFNIDFNGKKMPWETIVLIPFVKEEDILEFEEMIRLKYTSEDEEIKHLRLSEKEIMRNNHGKSYLIYYKDEVIYKNEYQIYCENTNTNLNSNYHVKEVAYNFPTIKTVLYDYTIDFKKSYNKKDFKKLRFINIKPKLIKDINEEKINEFLMNGIVFINYPFKYEALLRGIFYKNKYYFLDNGRVIINSKYQVNSELKDIIKRDLYKKGVMIEPDILCNVSTFKRIVRNCDGSIIKIYDDQKKFMIPFELTSLNSHKDDFVLMLKDFEIFKSKFINIDNEFNKDKCLILSKVNYGCVGKVDNIINNSFPNYEYLNNINYDKFYDSKINYDLQKKDWEIELEKLYNGPLIKVDIDTSFQDSFVTDPYFAKNIIKKTNDKYTKMSELAQILGTTNWTLGLITSSLFVVNCTLEENIDDDAKIVDLSHWNIGLNMKLRMKNQKYILPGYTKIDETCNNEYDSHVSWEFSDKAIETIREYKNNFNFVFEALDKFKVLYNRTGKFFKIWELFASIDNCEERLNDIANWINTHEISKSSFTPSNSNFLSKSDCIKIQEYVNEKNKSKTLINEVMYLNPNYIYQESLPWIPPFHADEPELFKIGDRVTNIRSTDYNYVPFGSKGTITAIHDEYLEVMFDNEFFGGITCNGRFATKCGANIRPLNLINLSLKNPIFLRRNKNKYHTWNFQPNFFGYVKQNENTKGYETNNIQTKKNIIKKDDTELKHAQSDNIPELVKGNIFKPSSAKYNINLLENKVNSSTPLNVNKESYIPKKIIMRKDDKSKIQNNFKKSSFELKPIEQVLNEKNVSNYRNNVIFRCEALKENQLYFYTFSDNYEKRLENDEKIIFKKNI